jgi:hypothetical protein
MLSLQELPFFLLFQGQLLATASSGFSMGRNSFLLLGLASLTIWAISYFRGN